MGGEKEKELKILFLSKIIKRTTSDNQLSCLYRLLCPQAAWILSHSWDVKILKLVLNHIVSEQDFQNAAKRGFNFTEFHINGSYNIDRFLSQLSQIKMWAEKYAVGVGSINRWNASMLNGNIDPREIETAYELIDAASYLNCSNYVCGYKLINKIPYVGNSSKSIDFFRKLTQYSKLQKVSIFTFNYRKIDSIHNPLAWSVIHGNLSDVGIKLDSCPTVGNEEDYLEGTQARGHRFYHFNIKGVLMVNGLRVNYLVGLDQIGCKSFLSSLCTEKFDRGLIVEHHSPNWQGELGQKEAEYSIGSIKSLLFQKYLITMNKSGNA